MKKLIIIFLGLFLLATDKIFSQIIVPNFTACPNQTMLVSPVWNNVSNISYFLTIPNQAPTQIAVPFVISSPTVGAVVFTLTGNGTANSGTVTSTVLFNLTVNAAPPLTFTNSSDFCYGSNAQFITTIGGANYQVTGGCAGNMNSTSNIINIPNLTSSCAGNYTVNSTINGCARTGVTIINVAPNSQLVVSSPTDICEGTNAVLTASLANGTDYQWLDQNNNALASLPPYNTYNIINATANMSGVYTATANIAFNSIKCPRTATTSVLVVVKNNVTASASPANIVCQSSPLNLNAVAAQASSWMWNGPQSFFSTSQNPSILFATPNNNGNYSVTAIFTGGSAVCTTSAVVNVSVVPVSQPVISMPSSVCENTTAIVMTVTTSGSPIKYEWTGPCVPYTLGQSASIATVFASCSGVYYATAVFQINTTTCISTASAALNVVPVNSITVVPPVSVCMPDNGFLQASAPGANSFIWQGPNNFTNPGANVTVYNPTPASSGDYTVTAFFSGGNIVCSNTAVANLVINPVLNFSLNPRTLICYNSPITLTGPDGATSYTWTSSTGFTSNDKDIIFTSIQTKDAGTYTLNINYGPCKTSGFTEVEVLDHITFSLTPANKTVCAGDTIYLEGGAQGGSQNYAYYWNPPVYMDSPNGPVKWVVPLGSVQYNLIVHDIACPFFTIATTCSLTVNKPSIPDLHLTPGQGCAPLTMNYNSQIPAGEAIVTYDFGGNEIQQKDNFNYALKKAGTYTLNIHTKNRVNGCSYDYTYPYPITVLPGPGSDFYLNPEKPTPADRVTFVPTSTYDPIVRYFWQFEGGVDLLDTSTIVSASLGKDTSDLKNPVRQYNQSGYYRTMLITENDYGCIDTTYKVINIIDELNVYIPNTFTPNGDGINDIFYIKGMGMKLENFDMQIVDRWGNVVFETRDINKGWDGTVRGAAATENTYTCFVKVVGMNGEGRKQFTSHVNIIK